MVRIILRQRGPIHAPFMKPLEHRHKFRTTLVFIQVDESLTINDEHVVWP